MAQDPQPVAPSAWHMGPQEHGDRAAQLSDIFFDLRGFWGPEAWVEELREAALAMAEVVRLEFRGEFFFSGPREDVRDGQSPGNFSTR